jgi:lysophospholipase L1-like esterase
MLPPILVLGYDTIVYENFSAAGGLSTCGVWLNADWSENSNAAITSGDNSATLAVPAGAAYFVPTIITAQKSAATLRKLKNVPTNKISKYAIYPPIGNGLNGMAFTSFGDSITYNGVWQPYIIAEHLVVHTNCGIGSTKLAGTGATAFHQTVRLDAVKAADPDIVTILGGANDITDGDITIGTAAEFAAALGDKNTATFVGAYSKIIETLLAWKPTLRIIILGTTWAHMDGVDVRAAGSSLTYTDFSDASKLVAQYYGLPFADLHGECGFNAFTMEDSPNNIYSADHIHPNAAGAKRIAEVVSRAFEKAFLFD